MTAAAILHALGEPRRIAILPLVRDREYPSGEIAARFPDVTGSLSCSRCYATSGTWASSNSRTQLKTNNDAQDRAVAVSEIDAIICETNIAAHRRPSSLSSPSLICIRAGWVRGRNSTRDQAARTHSTSMSSLWPGPSFLEVVPHSRIVFTFGWEGDDRPVPPGWTTVAVTLTPTAEGTHVRLVHRGLRVSEMRDQHRDGWQRYLARLSLTASGGEAGSDPNANPPQEA